MSKEVKVEKEVLLPILEEGEMTSILQEEQGQAHNYRVRRYDLGNRILELLVEETISCSKRTN